MKVSKQIIFPDNAYAWGSFQLKVSAVAVQNLVLIFKKGPRENMIRCSGRCSPPPLLCPDLCPSPPNPATGLFLGWIVIWLDFGRKADCDQMIERAKHILLTPHDALMIFFNGTVNFIRSVILRMVFARYEQYTETLKTQEVAGEIVSWN